MKKFGSCEFTVNDLVLYTSREGISSDDVYEVIEVLPNKDGYMKIDLLLKIIGLQILRQKKNI